MNKHRAKAPNTSTHPDDVDDALTLQLAEQAVALAQQAKGKLGVTPEVERGFPHLIKKALLGKKDEVLYDAIERARDADLAGSLLLRDAVEEASEVVIIRRDDGSVHEINAFVIPLFVHSVGGLRLERTFQDQQAFEELTASFVKAGLESPDARVVLVSHAFHVDEIDRITYSHLNEMTRDAGAALLGKKSAPVAALERSMAGWPQSYFEPADTALELRFLLGFACKRADDPFYAVPASEAKADAYFAAREERFRDWTQQYGPIVQRVLGGGTEIDFLYQDLFHGGKERGIAEYYTLQLMSELNLDLQEHAIDAADTSAVIAPSDSGGEVVLQVNLYAQDGSLVASSEKPFGASGSLQAEVEDMRDALSVLGVASFAQALRFDAAGNPVEPRSLA
ncbi:MAG TPA: DUF2863 family protein [Burkholderiaceae bacterium]